MSGSMSSAYPDLYLAASGSALRDDKLEHAEGGHLCLELGAGHLHGGGIRGSRAVESCSRVGQIK